MNIVELELTDEDIEKWIVLLKRMDMKPAINYLREILQCAAQGSYSVREPDNIGLKINHVVARKKYKCGCGCRRVIRPKDVYVCYTAYKYPVHHRLRVHWDCQDKNYKDGWLRLMGLRK